jgi:predicted secreted protein
MSFASALAIYVLFWSLTLFAVLPFGVRTTLEEGGEPVLGEADSAPSNPMLGKKLVWTTIISTALFALFYANFLAEWVTLDDIPGWEDSGPHRGQLIDNDPTKSD